MNNPTNEYLLSKIEEEENRLEHAKYYKEKCSYLNNILQFKLLMTPLNESEIYRNLKTLIMYYSRSLEEKTFNYDTIDFGFIEEYLLRLNLENRINILKFSIRIFKGLGYDEITEIEASLHKYELQFCLHNIGFKNLIKGLHLCAIYSWWSIILSILVLLLISCITLLPAPSWSYPIFQVDYMKISKNFYCNHFLNVLIGVFDVDDRFKVTPLNAIAAIICIIWKLTFLFVLISILMDQLKKKIKI